MTTIMDLSSQQLRNAAALKEQIDALERQLSACLGNGPAGNGSRSRRPATRAAKPGSAKGKKTVADCVLEALADGRTLTIQQIAILASRIRGKGISPGLMSFTLAQMKKAKRVVNVARGQYRKP